MKLIQRKNYLNVPWKNGQGQTELIEQSTDLAWRMSVATIRKPSAFSEYPGQKRLLSIWKGDGLLLNDFELKPDFVFEFNGDGSIYCKNINSEVIDFGVIYNPLLVSIKMNFMNLFRNETIYLSSEINYLFCAEGEFQVNEMTIHEGDTLKLTNEKIIQILLNSEKVKLIKIEIDLRPELESSSF